MDVLNEIAQNSALRFLSKGYQNLELLLFSSIIFLLFTMLVILIVKGSNSIIQFGY